MYTFVAKRLDGSEIELVIDSIPDTCPICHHGIEPIFQFSFIDKTEEIQAVFRCPRSSCNNLFIAYYSPHTTRRGLVLYKVAPQITKPQEFSSEVKALSPSFVEIYNQAFSAESFELDQICGCGYRKALEFLIKDYVIYKSPTLKDEIEKKKLAKVINENVDDTKIKTTAELATWLGNDETHFVRKWTDLDIKDLKQLIQLTVKWIESEIITADYKTRMRSK
jgi:hypothetical protein